MALDRDAERVLEMVRLAGRPPYETMTAPEARALFLAGREVVTPDPMPVAEVRELSAPREDGGAVPIRLYRGATAVSGGVVPGLVYFHGGGWVIGDLDTHDSLCRHLANAAQCVVVSVDYRLAPEHKFPAAVEDCFAATSWVAEQASPLRARDVSGVAPALVLTAGNDVLCDEGEAYARRLEQNRVQVLRRHFPDQIHGFLTMGKIIAAAQPALEEVAVALRTAWAAA